MGITEIVHDHAEIEHAAVALRKLAADEATDMNALGDAVAAFRTAVERHFESEERELFPRLRQVAPDLVPDIDDLERQHAEMRHDLVDITAALSHDRAQTAAAVEKLWAALDAHAEKEASILAVTHDAAFPGDVMGG